MDTNSLEGSNPAESSLAQDMGMSGGAESPSLGNPLMGDDASGQAGMTQGFKFAGKEYADRQSAEKAHQKLYGTYSETKGILNTVKKALANPELMEKLSEDPAWAEIFAKLGIEQSVENAEREDQSSQRQGGQDQQTQEMHQWRVEREESKLEREAFRFERTLGREVKPTEHSKVLSIIARAPRLTYAEGWKLAMHDTLLQQRNQQGAQQPGQRPASNRPAPPPVRTPGTAAPSKKGVSSMNNSEWKANLANDPELRDLLSKRNG